MRRVEGSEKGRGTPEEDSRGHVLTLSQPQLHFWASFSAAASVARIFFRGSEASVGNLQKNEAMGNGIR